MNLEQAFEAYDRATPAIREGRMTAQEYERLLAQLRALRETLYGRDRTRVDLYLSMLQEEWAAATGMAAERSRLLVDAERLMYAALRRQEDRRAWLADVNQAMEEIADLEEQAPASLQRPIALLLEPLDRLADQLERELGEASDS